MRFSIAVMVIVVVFVVLMPISLASMTLPVVDQTNQLSVPVLTPAPLAKVQPPRSPVEIEGAWYMLASDFTRATYCSQPVFDQDKKSLFITWSGRSVTYVVGSAKAQITGDVSKTVKLARPIWTDADRVVVPIKETTEALRMKMGVERDKGSILIMDGLRTVEITLTDQPKWAGIDLARQRILIYQGDWLIENIRCSTGRGWHGRNRKTYQDVYWVVLIGGAKARSITYGVKTPYKWFLAKTPGGVYCEIAIHGFRSVPGHPASHGCIRAPIPDAKALYEHERLEIGSPIQVQLTALAFKPWRELFPKSQPLPPSISAK